MGTSYSKPEKIYRAARGNEVQALQVGLQCHLVLGGIDKQRLIRSSNWGCLLSRDDRMEQHLCGTQFDGRVALCAQ